MNLGSLQTARRDWHRTYTLLKSTCKVFVAKALALFTVEQILSESWFLWSTDVRKGDENAQKRIILPREAFCQADQIWSCMSGLCFPGSIWWARMASLESEMAPGLKALLASPQHLQLLPRDKSFALGFTDKLGLSLSIGLIRKELWERVAKVQPDCATPHWKGELEEVTGHPYFGFLSVP